MPRTATVLFLLCLLSQTACAEVRRVTPDDPAALYAAVADAQPGDVIELADGTYALVDTVKLRAKGAEAQPITLTAAAGAHPVLDFSQQEANSKNRGLEVKGDWWRLVGLTVANAGDNGINVTGHHNTIERCAAHDCRDTGIQVHQPASYTLVTDCDSFRNFDDQARGESADGFAAKFDVGPGNVFRRCRAWDNADDGYDLWKAPHPVLLEDCLAFANGVNWKHIDGFTGDGNGFKLGGDFVPAAHVVRRCVAVDQPHHGFDQNNNTGPLTIEDCIAIRCGVGFYLPDPPADEKNARHTLRGNLSVVSPVTVAPGSLLEGNHWPPLSD